MVKPWWCSFSTSMYSSWVSMVMVPPGLGAWSPETLEGPLAHRVDTRCCRPRELSSTANFVDHRTRIRVIIDREIR